MKPHRGRRPNRAGYALVLFIMMFFGLMGLAALVIDLGFVRLAQRQMQTAVDSAALEGLRNDPTTAAGRQQASQIVAQMFTDYVDSSGATVHYGAGPVVDFSGGVGPVNLAAGQTITWPPPPPYQPKRSDGTPGLELNYTDELNGDMLAGAYGQNTVDPPDGAADEGTTATDSSGNPYHRRDFQKGSSQAFLVRMRRTPLWNVPGSWDDTPGVSSAGPTLPFLFGRGSTIYKDPTSAYSPRQQGLTVRATAIAAAGDNIQFGSATYSAGRAKAAGQPYQYTDPTSGNQVSLPGVAPFAVKAGSWPSATPLQIAPIDAKGQVPTGPAELISATTIVMIGQRVGSSNIPPGNANEPQSGNLAYVPIYDDIQDDVGNTYYGIVVGFGAVQSWQIAGNFVTFTALPSGRVGSCNVTGVLPPGLTMDTTAVSAVFRSHGTFQNPLYAPVLVNHYIGPQQSNP